MPPERLFGKAFGGRCISTFFGTADFENELPDSRFRSMKGIGVGVAGVRGVTSTREPLIGSLILGGIVTGVRGLLTEATPALIDRVRCALGFGVGRGGGASTTGVGGR